MESRKESQSTGSVGMDVYKSYYKSVDNMVLVVMVMTFIIIGQIAISSVDLFVSKWYLNRLDSLEWPIINTFEIIYSIFAG